MTGYLTLCPVPLLQEIGLPQERLAEISGAPSRSSIDDGGALPLEEFLSGLSLTWRSDEVRTTTRAKPAARRLSTEVNFNRTHCVNFL